MSLALPANPLHQDHHFPLHQPGVETGYKHMFYATGVCSKHIFFKVWFYFVFYMYNQHLHSCWDFCFDFWYLILLLSFQYTWWIIKFLAFRFNFFSQTCHSALKIHIALQLWVVVMSNSESFSHGKIGNSKKNVLFSYWQSVA